LEKHWRGIFKVICISLVCSNVVCSNIVLAKDFGVEGHTYEIQEQDILEYIESKLRTLDLEKIKSEAKERVKKSVNRPKPVDNISDAKEDREYFYDPTFILEETLFDHLGRVIHPAGTRINPLERIPLREVLIFINGDNEKQVKFAITEHTKRDKKAKIILIKGSPIELQRKHKIWIYFDQEGILTGKFGIAQVPAVVSQEGKRLKINEIGEKQ
jgi:conjugal transfer pilus assembly protein TraW